MGIASNNGTYIIAEMSANHGNSLERSKAIIDACRAAGVNAVKFQTFTADSMTLNLNREEFRINNRESPWFGRRLYDLYSDSALPYDWHADLFDYVRQAGLDPISTPFCRESTDLIVEAGTSAIKIASAELVDIDLIAYAAGKGLPLILSTGMSTLREIAEAVETARSAGCTDLTILKCTTSYPASPEESNLKTISNLKETFQTRVGLSDHSMGSAVPVAAVALGASVVEKHITLSRNDATSDAHFSMEPNEFKRLVEDIRVVERAIGTVQYSPLDSELASRGRRRSLYFCRSVKKGQAVSVDDLRSIRPGNGISTKYRDMVTGMRAAREINAGDPVSWDCFKE